MASPLELASSYVNGSSRGQFFKVCFSYKNYLRTLVITSSLYTFYIQGGNEEKVGLFKKFKKMWKDYWYVMIPVHIVTSAGWLGGFYVMCKSGLDVPAILAAMGTSQEYLEKISRSDYTYIALSYACYKVATPARYRHQFDFHWSLK